MLRSNGNARALAGIQYLVDFVSLNRSWQEKNHHCWGMAAGRQGTGDVTHAHAVGNHGGLLIPQLVKIHPFSPAGLPTCDMFWELGG